MSGSRTFVIASCLGRGGFGEVYRATMSGRGTLEQDVAVKVLRRDIDPDGQAVRRLRDEGRLLSRLDHPTILRVHDLVLLDGRISLVTELVDGADLSTCMEGPDGLGLRALVEVVGRVAAALDAAWSTVPPGADRPLRMVHRDIKPSNIRISRHGRVKLLDFGIARTDSFERESRTRTGMLVGSPAYMAPERFLEQGTLVQSDVFALGAILYEGVSGERFYGTLPLPMQVGLAVHRSRFEAHLTERLQGIADSPAHELVARMLAFSPDDRPLPDEVSQELVDLTDRIRGISLDRWCRRRSWEEGPSLAGELVGRTVTEGLLAPMVSASLVPETRVEPDGRLPTVETLEVDPPPLIGWGAVGSLGLLAALLGVGSIGAGVAVASALLVVLEPPVEEPVVPSPVPEAAVPEEAEPEVEVAEEPVAPEPAVVPSKPSPRPPAVRAARVVAPPPVQPAEPPGRIAFQGDGRAFLRSSGGDLPLPATVPPGSYEVHASLDGLSTFRVGTVEVRSGSRRTLVCSRRMGRCTWP